jgi:hypothetical protein
LSLAWLGEHLDNFMIRLGQLKAVLAVSDTSQQGKERVTGRYASLIAKSLEVNFDKNLHLRRYVETKGIADAERKRMLSSGRLEIQDIYLSDPALPSNLGRVPREVAHEIVMWATWMHILKPNLFSLLPFGQMLATVASTSVQSFKQLNPKCNPFLIREERPIFLYQMLTLDGDLIKRMLIHLLTDLAPEFDRMEAVEPFRKALIDLLERLQKQDPYLRYVETRRRLRQLIETLRHEEELRHTKGKRALTGMQLLSSRLENLVDMGLLENSSADQNDLKLEYRYKVTLKTKAFLETLRAESDLPRFLESGFFKSYARLFTPEARLTQDPEIILPYLISGYKDVGRTVGPTPISFMALSGATRAVNDALVFEIQDAVSALIQMREKHGYSINLSGGEIRGKPGFVTLGVDVLRREPNQVGE